jgi:hypothetical protein
MSCSYTPSSGTRITSGAGASASTGAYASAGSFAGSTTVLSQPAYVVDVLALGSREAFRSGLGKLLESRDVLKVTLDCRTDSDALAHQFEVRLANVLDLQVLEQRHRTAKRVQLSLYKR